MRSAEWKQTDRPQLKARARFWISIIILGLFLSGATAIPLNSEVSWLAKISGANITPSPERSGLQKWISTVQTGLEDTSNNHPFLFYGTDWLAFGHFMIALVFVGPWLDPARNLWILRFGMIACVCVIPYAFIFGAVRGIPIFWRLIDCSFGVFGFIPAWLAYRCAIRLEQIQNPSPTPG